ncbi:MAG: outer membrane lipoprotein carrier protein LolA [Candidatus Kuenenia sp.]|nr:outer membrane lipoprotein carrier protein LolA [Candidatus Kuenenia hertensis]
MDKQIFNIIFFSLFAFVISIFLVNRITLCNETTKYKTLDEVLLEVEKADGEFKTMKAGIVITRTIPLLESTEISKGKIHYKKPDRLLLKFDPPRDEVNIIDGKHIWVYHPKAKQVEKYTINKGKQTSQSLNFFGFGYGESVASARKDYTISLTDTTEIGKKCFYVLDLLPRNTSTQYTKIRLWIDEGLWLPVKIELHESGGEVVNIIEFDHIKLNSRMSDKLFVFDVPRGVEVVEPFQ